MHGPLQAALLLELATTMRGVAPDRFEFRAVRPLVDGGDIIRTKSQIAEGQLTAYEIAGENVELGYRPTPLGTTAGQSLAAIRKFGSPALSEPELTEASLLTRQAADRALAGSLGIKLVAGRDAAAGKAEAPQVVHDFAARVSRRAGCVAVAPETPVAWTETPTPARLAELSLPPAGIEIAADDLSDVDLALGKFAPPSVPLAAVMGRRAVLRTPPDESSLSWKLVVTSGQPVSVCGLPGG